MEAVERLLNDHPALAKYEKAQLGMESLLWIQLSFRSADSPAKTEAN